MIDRYSFKSSCGFSDIMNLQKYAVVNITSKLVITCSQIHIIYLSPLVSPR